MRGSVFAICLIVLGSIITGCWDRKELDDIAITAAVGLDKVDDQYLVTAQVVVPSGVSSKRGGTTLLPVVTLQEKDDTIHKAIRKMTTLSPRRLYLGHVRMLVIGEDLAREGLGDALDIISRNPEIRTDFFVIIAKERKAADALKILTVLDQIPATKLYSSLDTSFKFWAPTSAITMDVLLKDLISAGKEAVLTGLKIRGSLEEGAKKSNLDAISPPALLQYAGLAVFHEDKLVGWLNEDEGKGYNYIRDEVKGSVGSITCPQGGTISLQIIRNKTKLKGNVKNNRPSIEVSTRSEVNISEIQCPIDISNNNTILELEKLSEKSHEEFMLATIKKVQKDFKSDIFGFGEIIHRSYPMYWKTIKDNWDKEFQDLQVEVISDIKIRRTGTVNNSIMESTKE